MRTTDTRENTRTDKPEVPLGALLPLVLDIGLPLGGYYLLKGFGVDVITALVVSGLVPAVRTIYTTVRKGRPDQFALAVLILTVVSIPITLWTGSPTFMLAKDGLGTATLGIWVIVMALRGQPLMATGTKPFLAPSGARAQAWDELLKDSPRFRKLLVSASFLWGFGFIVEVVARLLIVFLLPFDTAVWATNIPLYVMIVGCSVFQQRWLMPVRGLLDERAKYTGIQS
jgi:hypothetical protein